jgi:hypothetical protein
MLDSATLDTILSALDDMRLSMDFDNSTLDEVEDRIISLGDTYQLEQVALDLENFAFPEPIDSPDFIFGEEV